MRKQPEIQWVGGLIADESIIDRALLSGTLGV
jgi:hypothetical protein